MLAAISFIFILSFLVLIHEAGHFLAAKWAKIKVDEFGLGYPPQAKKLFRWRETVFSLNWIPFGGFVRLRGEDDQLKNKTIKQGDFAAASLWQRLLVMLAGATVNFLFGILAFAFIFTKIGIPTPLDSARINTVAADSPAARAGIKANWEINQIQVADQVYLVHSPSEVAKTVMAHRGQTLKLRVTGPCHDLVCQSNQKTYTVYARTKTETPNNQGAIGIVFQPVVYLHYPLLQMPFRGIWVGLQQAFALTGLILGALGKMVTQLFVQHQLIGELAGPVGIVYQAQSSGLFAQGFLAVLSFTAMLSINLAIMNVLPIPPLDGGRALLALSGAVIGKKITDKLEYYLNYGGWILMMLLIVTITARDIWRIFR